MPAGDFQTPNTLSVLANIPVTGDECEDLFDNNTNFVRENDVVVYFIASLADGANGVHPGGEDGAIVALVASPWTLAHEVGHVLDLEHIDDGIDETTFLPLPRQLDHLMTGAGTWMINVASPVLDTAVSAAGSLIAETTIMKDSDLTQST